MGFFFGEIDQLDLQIPRRSPLLVFSEQTFGINGVIVYPCLNRGRYVLTGRRNGLILQCKLRWFRYHFDLGSSRTVKANEQVHQGFL